MEPDDDKTRTHTVLTKGTKIGRYRIEKQIGAGGMGEVYLAEDTELDRKVALKFLPSHLCQDEDCRKRFKREAQAAAKLSHPNIIHVYEVSEFQGRPFFAMEHIEGRSLRDVKAEELDVDRIVGIAIQLCDGLHSAHAAGVTHRDIKPSNIVIDSSGRPRLLDFGLATVKGGEQLTKTGSTLGTVGYMSPEQIEGKATDARSDLFSLGVVLYELIANKSPFRRDDETATLKAILQDTPQPLARFNSNVPDDLQRIITKLLEKDPSLRYQSATGVIPDLKRLSAVSTASVTIGRKPDRWNRYIVPSAVVILLAVVAIWYFGYRDQAPATTAGEDRVMLAVLPFENLGDPDDEYFAEGITDEIAARLSSVENIRIIGRRSVKQYKETSKSIQEIGNELAVDFLLDGTVRWQRSSDGSSRVRVTPQLLRVSDGSSLWSAVYDDPLTEVFDVQAAIAGSVVDAFSITLGKLEEAVIGMAPTADLEAYDYYLRAQDYYWNFSAREDLDRSIALYRKAVELDSTFVRAWVDMSMTMAYYHWSGYDTKGEMGELARTAAEVGARHDSSEAYSPLAHAYCYYYCDGDYLKALKEFERFSQRFPDNAAAKAGMGYVQRRLGNWDQSLSSLIEGLHLEPMVAYYYDGLTQSARYMRRFDVADLWLARGMTLFPDLIHLQVERILLHLAVHGDPSAALELIDSLPDAIRSNERVGAVEMKMQFWSGEYEDALTTASSFYERAQTPTDTAFYFTRVATIYDHLGDLQMGQIYYDSAGKYIESAIQGDSPLRQGGTFEIGKVYSKLYGRDVAIQATRDYVSKVPLSKDAFFGTDMLLELAYCYAWVGELDSALAIIDTLLSVPSPLTVPRLRVDRDFESLHHHPRFEALLEKYEKERGI